MAAIIGKYAAKKLLNKEFKKYKDRKVVSNYDPYFVEVTLPNGRKKRLKKQIPDYIPEKDAVILAKVRKRAYYLDMSLFEIFGERFGWSSIIGLVPVVGDTLDLLMAFNLMRLCFQVDADLGGTSKSLMVRNIIIDWVIGFVPFVGDFLDGSFKCNTRNVRLLEQCLDEAYMPAHLKEKVARDKETLKAELAKKKSRSKRKLSEVEQQFPPAAVLEEVHDGEPLLPIQEPATEPRQPERARTTPESAPPPDQHRDKRTRHVSRFWK